MYLAGHESLNERMNERMPDSTSNVYFGSKDFRARFHSIAWHGMDT